ncbi:bactofilin family protein [Cupriavidus necator]|uniref:bactofilin family protein n=1 Tax=Cupriavidus necator TaxID=106590 RepID=UPI0027872A0B|nr:polymer-forming cytoskeletal protein [Cupriavidus necator]MDQ0141138.1 cytoskeletal protein CcmA (bactofilin family) [Cupriavidus necator]
MLFSKKKGLSIDTLIGEDTAIDGDLVFAGGLRLDGRVRGNVTAAPGKPSMLVVSEKGMVEGEISVGHLVLNGTVKGPVHAADLLELQPQARVLGDVRYAALEMHQGALVEGRLMPLVPGEVRALPNLVEAGPVGEVTEAAADEAAAAAETAAADGGPTEKAA